VIAIGGFGDRDALVSVIAISELRTIGQRGDTAMARERIDGLRDWLRANRRVDGSTGRSS
jgi:hypothetical protein